MTTLQDPFLSLAPATTEPMTQDTYDGLRDDIKAAYLLDHARVTEFLDGALSCLGVIAQTGVDADNRLAADFLERLSLRAKSGTPPGEPAFDPDDFGPERHRDIKLEDS